MVSAAIKLEDDFGIEHFADELKPGVSLMHGHYRIESFLNAGGFGITYIALDTLDRRVVIKECFPSSFCRRTDNLVGPRSRQREDEFQSMVTLFKQEATNLARLEHPNIVKVHQVFDENQTAYMSMDYICGPDLLDTVEGTAPRLKPDEIMSLLGKLLDALAYVHAQGFLHRDISPDNILLDRATGEPILIDFGAARKDVTRRSRAVSGLRVVKDGYSPQEFYISGGKQAPNSDLYALAATFCHLITGEAPKTSQERLAAIANREGDPQRPVLGRVKGYPKEFLAAIDKAMSIFPKDRMQSAAEWQSWLRDVSGPALRIVTYQNHQAEDAVAPATRNSLAAPAAPAPAPARPAVRTLALASVAAAMLFSGFVAYDRKPADTAASARAAVVAGAMTAPFTVGAVAALPYLADPVDPTLVLGRLPWSPDWVVPGLRIVEVNGAPVAQPALLQALVAATTDIGAAQSVEVSLGHEAAAGGATVRESIAVPVVEELRLAEGIVFQLHPSPMGPRTVVTAVPDGAATDLRPGDVLLAYGPTGETLVTQISLRDLLQRELGKSIATYSFAVQREGGVAVASFTVARGE